MRRHIILTILILCFGTYSFAQNHINMVENLNIKQDIVSLEKRITGFIKKKSEIANIQGLRQFHIFLLGISGSDNLELKKEDYIDHSFLYRLRPMYYDLNSNFLFKRKFLLTETLITDSIGNLVATGSALLVHIPPSPGQYDLKLAKMLFDKEIDFVCLLAFPHCMNYMVGIKGDNLYALENVKGELKIYLWDEFIECCFDKWISNSLMY